MNKVDYVVMVESGHHHHWQVFSGQGALGVGKTYAERFHGKLYRRVTSYDLEAGLDKATEKLTLVETFP